MVAKPHPLPTVCPSGFHTWPLLFNICMPPLGDIIHHHGLHFHSYAHYTQLYISIKPSAHLPPQLLINCISDIETWTTQNFLKLNINKTKLLVFAPKSQLPKVEDLTLTTISPSSEVCSLGVTLHSTLSFQTHTAEKFIHTLITSCLDYFSKQDPRLASVHPKICCQGSHQH